MVRFVFCSYTTQEKILDVSVITLTLSPLVNLFSFEGYIMDGYCIGEGFLFDNPDVVSLSLEGPGVHTAMWYVFCVVLAIH